MDSPKRMLWWIIWMMIIKKNSNSETSDEYELNNVNEDKYINYDEVNWVNPPGWEQDAPYVDGRPFTGIVYENYPNGQTSVEDHIY